MDKGLQRLKGTRDVLGDEALALEMAGRALQSLCSGYGYELIDTPVLESPELFLRKSGGETASHIYAFTDPGGRPVSLRPEFTASVIRGYLQGGPRQLPLRWQYRGPVFQYVGDGSPNRQFTQLGAELVGASGPLADAEVLSLALQGLRILGLRDYHITLGHVGIPSEWLACLGLSERVRLFLLGHLSELAQGPEGMSRVEDELRRTGLSSQEVDIAPRGKRVKDRQALLQSLVQELAPELQGGRTPQEIVSRFIARSEGRDRPELVAKGLSLTYELGQVKGPPASALSQARQVAGKYHVSAPLLDDLEELLYVLSQAGLGEEITVDLGLARGLAYYTGVVFEVRHRSLPPGPSLCGGGRYDGLVKSLGGSEDVPALGFAYCMERVTAAIALEGSAIAPPLPRVLLCPADPSARGAALKAAQAMRANGVRVELELSGLSPRRCLSEARRRGIPKVVVVAEDGEVKEHVLD